VNSMLPHRRANSETPKHVSYDALTKRTEDVTGSIEERGRRGTIWTAAASERWRRFLGIGEKTPKAAATQRRRRSLNETLNGEE
jgi:hypothetical protein